MANSYRLGSSQQMLVEDHGVMFSMSSPAWAPTTWLVLPATARQRCAQRRRNRQLGVSFSSWDASSR